MTPRRFTGVNPGKHGVYGFTGFDGYDFHVVKGDDVHAHRLWTLLDHHGHSSVVVNVPVTHPPDEIDGAIIPGFIGPEDPPCHPKGILDDVREAIGAYRVYPRYARGDDSLSDAEKIDEYCTLVEMRGDAFRYLVDRFEPNFGFLQFQKTDTVFHEFDGEWEKVKRVYAAADEQIGAVLEACTPRRVFVASDHGMGRYEKPEFRVNAFLEDAGYLETTLGGKGMPTWNAMRDDLRDGEQADEWEPSTVERIAAALASVGITAHRTGLVLERLGLGEFAKAHVPDGVVRTGNEQVDFPRSKAYVRARTELGVRMNVEGRDPDGTIPQDEYEAVRADLVRELESVTAPDGEPVFQEVAPREAFFEGPYTDRAVDIVTVPTSSTSSRHSRARSTSSRRRNPGTTSSMGYSSRAARESTSRDPSMTRTCSTSLRRSSPHSGYRTATGWTGASFRSSRRPSRCPIPSIRIRTERPSIPWSRTDSRPSATSSDRFARIE